MAKLTNLSGKRYGKLTVQKLLYSKKQNDGKHYSHYYLCRCDCGNEKIVVNSNLLTGNTQSCGCLKKEKPNHKKHNLSKHKLYRVYKTMINRCYNPKNISFKIYGKRGIAVCKEWQQDFMIFYNWAINAGYKEGLSIDRIDVNGNYEPTNCRWATTKEQSNNRRTNRFISYKGETHTISQWERITGIDHRKISARLKLGWEIQRIFQTP